MLNIPPCESEIVVFQRVWSDAVLKDIVALANTFGGELYIGVNEIGKLIGVEQPANLEKHIISLARETIYPSVLPLLSLRRITSKNKTAIVVHVTAGSQKPYCTDPGDISTIYVRFGARSITASYAQVCRFVADADPTPWESRIAVNQSLTFDFCRAYALSKNLDFDPAQDDLCGFVDSVRRNYTNLAYLCSDQNHFKIVVSVFADEQKSQLIQSKEFTGSILKILQDAQDFILTECPVGMDKFVSTTSEEIKRDSISPDAIREVLTNMLVQRDYTRSSPCVVHLTPTNLLFYTAGGPMDFTREAIELQIPATSRNERLTDFLKAVHLIKDTGPGFDAIRSFYPTVEFSQLLHVSDAAFWLTLPHQASSVPTVPTHTEQSSTKKTLSDDAKILQLISRQSTVSRENVQKLLDIPRATANYRLQKLVAQNRIVKIGNGKSTRYSLKTND